LKILNLHLVNVRAHDDVTLDFRGTTTMILGHNGSGKSTIVESIYYALFRKLLVSNVEIIISDKIKKIDDAGKITYLAPSYIELGVEVDGNLISIKSALAKTTCSLKIYENERWVEKANKITEMYEYIKVHILKGMTPEYFINTVYTEQMGILRLVSKDPIPRQQEFDKLVGIDRFQKLHAAVANSFTILNKAKRNDIRQLTESLLTKVAKNRELIETQNGLDATYQELCKKKDTFVHVYNAKKQECDDLSKVSEKIYADYMSANELTTKYRETETLWSDMVKSLDELERTTPVKDIEKEADNLCGSLKMDYDVICERVEEFFNYIEKEKKVLSDKNQMLDSDIKMLEILEFHNRIHKEAKEKYSKCQETIIEKSKIANEQESETKKMSKDLKELDEVIKKTTEAIHVQEFAIASLLKDYNNCNYDFESIKEFMESSDDDYCGFTKDVYHCSYCGSNIEKDKMFERLVGHKKIYTSTSLLLEKLREEKIIKEQTQSMIKIEYDRRLVELTTTKNDISYMTMMSEEALRKIQSAEVEIAKYESKLSSSNDVATLKLERSKNDEKIKSISNEKDFRPLYSFKGISKTDKAITHDASKLANDIISYQTDLKKFQNLESSLKDYAIKHKNISDSILKFKQTMDDVYPKIVNTIKGHNCSSLQELYEKVKKYQTDVNNLRIELGSMSNDLSTTDQLMESNRSHYGSIDRERRVILQEIDSTNEIIKSDELIVKKIEMVNVAKAYFKQDGLAKDIRKFYIKNINDNMANYIGLFGFSFTPKIDETAGIENFEKYSGGQQISIAILEKMILNFILKNPINIMILDEPTPYMDEERIEAIKELVTNIKSKLQLILITHEKDFMSIDCNKVVFGNTAYEI